MPTTAYRRGNTPWVGIMVPPLHASLNFRFYPATCESVRLLPHIGVQAGIRRRHFIPVLAWKSIGGATTHERKQDILKLSNAKFYPITPYWQARGLHPDEKRRSARSFLAIDGRGVLRSSLRIVSKNASFNWAVCCPSLPSPTPIYLYHGCKLQQKGAKIGRKGQGRRFFQFVPRIAPTTDRSRLTRITQTATYSSRGGYQITSIGGHLRAFGRFRQRECSHRRPQVSRRLLRTRPC